MALHAPRVCETGVCWLLKTTTSLLLRSSFEGKMLRGHAAPNQHLQGTLDGVYRSSCQC